MKIHWQFFLGYLVGWLVGSIITRLYILIEKARVIKTENNFKCQQLSGVTNEAKRDLKTIPCYICHNIANHVYTTKRKGNMQSLQEKVKGLWEILFGLHLRNKQEKGKAKKFIKIKY